MDEGRGLKQLAQLSVERRLEAIAEGLSLIAENVRSLRDDIACLYEGKRLRAAEVMTGLADEEAAKTLILLDLVRAGVSDSQMLKQQTTRFYEHLARCIFAEMAHMAPASFGEIEGLVNLERRSHYLDGPDDVDWIFRNQLITEREQRLYVDYVVDEADARWISPKRFEDLGFGPLTEAPNLVIALEETGCTSLAGLRICADEWEGVVMESDTHWQVVAAINRRILGRLADQDPAFAAASGEDQRRVIDHWTFPLTRLDLRMDSVASTDLQEQRARTEADYSYGGTFVIHEGAGDVKGRLAVFDVRLRGWCGDHRDRPVVRGVSGLCPGLGCPVAGRGLAGQAPWRRAGG
jgi:AbiV family abortive infection protein